MTKEIKISVYTPFTNFFEFRRWTDFPVPNYKFNRIPGLFIEIAPA